MSFTPMNGANRLMPLSNEFRCACNKIFVSSAYRIHRLACDAWQRASQYQQDLYKKLCQERSLLRCREYTEDMALCLGIAYYHAHGQMPYPHKMKSLWCMPEAKTVYLYFGDLEGFHKAIMRAIEE